MMVQSFKIVDFNEVKDMIPEDSWMKKQIKQYGHEIAKESILYHRGDLRLEKLNFDDFLYTKQGRNFLLIVVEGHVTIDGYIYNTLVHYDDWFGAVGLIVLGDLHAGNIVIGGQEILVTGNLTVRDLFYGDYSGSLHVNGRATASVFFANWGYSVTLLGEQSFDLHVKDIDELVGEKAIADMDELLGFHSENFYFVRSKVEERLESGKPILNRHWKDNLRDRNKSIPFAFLNAELCIENIDRLMKPNLLPRDPYSGEHYKYEIWQRDLFIRVVATIQGVGLKVKYKAIYIEKVGEYAVMIEAFPKKWMPRSWGPLRISSKLMNRGNTNWYSFDSTTPEHFNSLLQTGWKSLLNAVSQYEYASRMIHRHEIEELLCLPVVQPYDDYLDTERNGFWIGSLYCSFRQKGVDENGHPYNEILKLARQYTDDHGEQKMECYIYYMNPQLDGSDTVEIKYIPDQYREEHVIVSYTDQDRLILAWRLFEAAKMKLRLCNEGLLNGKTPYAAEDFAIKYWEEQGYIEKG
ncbi:hypothetical protein [Bacillus horti]|uniref:Polymer-forming cytoskeletal protein n=1 Tax=Caldalkalibacillus horti TaxID=77523 RepID=A0ABT9VWL4_9BACI|nr:hypothetical protein [Bacillus horti]MDQ0165359.1 hypothetical protein [Bacillus horti]